MKLCLLLTFTTILHATAATYSQGVKLDIGMKNASLEQVMKTIRQQSEFSFFYDDRAVEKISNITLNLKKASVEDVLDICLKDSGFGYRIVDRTIVLYRTNGKNQQQPQMTVVTGKVSDRKGVIMPGVTVRMDGTTVGTATDAKGEFKLPLPVAKGTLIFSFVGFKQKKVNFDGEKPLAVILEEEISNLDEVTVVAYGSRKKRELTSAISSVKADDIKEMPTHSLENLLQGRMAGVEINNVSGAPGGGGSVVAIRGYNSLFVEGEGESRKYGEPLYVVDGVPIHSFSSPVTGANMLSDLNPSMIESVEVLKDAASAAIYGSRAGNGVILITTKKGREGHASFAANVSYSASWLPKTVEQVGGRDERLYHLRTLQQMRQPYRDENGNFVFPESHEGAFGGNGIYDYFWNGENGATPKPSPVLQDSLNPFYNNSTDWFRYAFQTAKVLNANIQMNGGNELMQYMIGTGYYDEEGIMINTGFQRADLMSNLTVRPSKRLRVDARTYFAYSDRSRGGESAQKGKIEGMSVDPKYVSTLFPGSGEVEKTVLDGLRSTVEKNQSYSMRLNLNLDYEILKGLNLSVAGSLDFNQQNLNHFEPSNLIRENRSKSNGSIARNIMLLNENLLHYNVSLNSVHNFDILLGLSFQKDQSFENGGSAEGGPNDKIQYVGQGWGGSEELIDVGNGNKKAAHHYSSSFDEETMTSYFGRITYNYDKRYFVDATLRRDGSSVFGEDVRWATFPSVSAGWNFSEEEFMKGLYWVSFAKIRASWGTSGRKFSQRYLAHGLMSPGGSSFMGETGMAPDAGAGGGMINKKLSWESTDQYDVGLDMDFFDYRLKVKLDYYYRYTKSQLTKVPLPGNIYYHGEQWQNALATSNQGIELEAEIDILRQTAVQWRVKINGAKNWNRFEKSYNNRDMEGYVLGKPLHQLKVYEDHGYYDSWDQIPVYYDSKGQKQLLHEYATAQGNTVFTPGMRRVRDLNSDGIISDADKYYAASPLPVANGGIISELRWKNFDLNLLFSYSIGRHIIKWYDDFKLVPSVSSGPIMSGTIDVSSWQRPGDQGADYPYLQPYGSMKSQMSGMTRSGIETVHHLRLKQLTIGYNVDDWLIRKLQLKGARVFLTMENLFLLTNYSGLDPEIVDIYQGTDNLRSYPLPRKFTVGLTVNF